MNKIEHSIILGYKDIYKKSFDEDFLESLKGFKSEDLIYILVQIITWIEEKKETHFILDKIISRSTFLENINKIKPLYSLENNKEIFHQKSCINFILKIINEKENININYDSENNVAEENFLFNLLKINENSFGNGMPIPRFDDEYYYEFCQLIFFGKTINFERSLDLFFEIIKIKTLANYFFDNNREIFDIFCEKFRIKNFDKWFLNLFSFLHQNYYNIFFFDLDDDNDLKLFFDYQLLNQFDSKNPSFDTLHIKPIYKINSKYLIIDKRLYFHNIFNVIDYSFFSILKDKQVVKTYGDYKSRILSYEINEKQSFRFLIKELFQKKKYLKIQFFENEKSPDCYIRDGNKVYIIEFKDNLAGNKILDLYDYISLRKSIDILFIKNEKGKPKGISQLFNFIKNFEITDLYDDEKLRKIDKSTLRIYPILITTDEFLSLPAIENYLTKEFKKMILSEKFNFKYINPLVQIQLSEIINFLDNNKYENFLRLINSYAIQKRKYKNNKNLFPSYPTFTYKNKKNTSNKEFLKKIFVEFKTTDDEEFLKQFFK